MPLPILSNLFGPKKHTPILAIDLGTDTVKTALCEVNGEGEVKILGRSEQKQGLTSMRGQKIADFDAVLETVNLACESAELNSNIKAKRATLGTSGLVQSVGMTVRLKRPEPEKEINQKELSYLFQKIEEKTIVKAKESLFAAETYAADGLIGSEATRYAIDGQKTETPLGLTGSILEVSLLHNFCAKADLTTLQSLASSLGLEIDGINETTTAITQTLLKTNEAGILIDIGGEITEVVIFKNGKIIGNKTFSLGGRNLSLMLTQKLNSSFEQVEKLKKDLAAGFLDAERAREVREIINEHFAIWVKGLETALTEFPEVRPLPASFLVTGGGAALEEVKSVLISHPWNRVLPFSTFPKIERLKVDPLEALARITG
ncbi:MAG: ethanolamine ammonia-lyase reactivating factor EutA [Candidatus Cloacimonetes bacterium]|nr:ethanolamine ammonia-lyase reactivating factor EutA [Candidatus Cloacimonadota bacterium]